MNAEAQKEQLLETLKPQIKACVEACEKIGAHLLVSVVCFDGDSGDGATIVYIPEGDGITEHFKALLKSANETTAEYLVKQRGDACVH